MQEIAFLKFIVESIVDKPEEVVIEKQDDEMWTLLTLQVAQSDMGIVIGKKGATVNALRSILRLQGMKMGKKITLRVIEIPA